MGAPIAIDLSSPLPWPDDVFDVVVGQQVIEHLELQSELQPLLREIWRVCRHSSEVWLSCPDMAKICTAYCQDRGKRLLADRNERYPVNWPGAMPSQHVINDFFHQDGQHKNLFDFELLDWALRSCGFEDILVVTELDLRRAYPEIPPRHDEAVSLTIRATVRKHQASR